MNESTITCPNCGNEFPLDAAFREHFEKEKHQAVAVATENARKQGKKEAEESLREEFDKQGEELKQSKEALAFERQGREEAVKSAQEKAESEAEKRYRLELQGKDEEIRRLGEKAAEMERRTRQGSMELQGEALEVWLKDTLQSTFPMDSIEDVKKGHHGADLVQRVNNPRGQRCGVIVWETKNAQSWNKLWIDKIHGDAERVNADLKVIVSAATPEGIKSFGLEDDVWVSNIESAPALALVLRQHMFQLYNLRRANVGREGKMEAVYDYLVSDRFADRVQRIVGTWKALKDQIDTEERAMRRQWKERHKQLDAMIDVTTDMYTDISAVIGADEMPQVDGLTLAALPFGEEG